MLNQKTTHASVLLLGSIVCMSSAQAGGFSREGDDIDMLFKPGNMIDVGSLFAFPTRTVKNASAVDRTGAPVTTGTTSTDAGVDVTVPRLTVKIQPGDRTDCMLAYRKAYGLDADYGKEWVGRHETIVSKIDMDSMRANCSYKFPVADGKNVRIIGGFGQTSGTAKRQNMLHQNLLIGGLGVPASVAVSDGFNQLDFNDSNNASTYQAGIAFENPKLAQRISLMYSSGADVELTGTQTVDVVDNGVQIVNRAIQATFPWPESVELKLQSGIKPGWIAFGGIKWQDWDKFHTIPIIASADGSKIADSVPGFQDGLTVTAGVGHKVSDRLGVQAFVKWDEGTSSGFNTYTDRFSIGAGGQYGLSKAMVLTLGGAFTTIEAGQATSAAPAVSYTFDDDTFFTVNAGLTFRY